MATRTYFASSRTHPGAASTGVYYRDLISNVPSGGTSTITAPVANQVDGERYFGIVSVTTKLWFFSERVGAEFTLAGTVNLSLWTAAPAAAGFVKLRARLYKITSGGSDVITELGVGTSAGTVGSSSSAIAVSITPTSTVIAKNERLLIVLSAVPADGGAVFDVAVNAINMTTNSTTLSWMDFNEAVTFRSNGTKLYLRRTSSSGVSGAYDLLEIFGSALKQNWLTTTASGTKIQFTKQSSPEFVATSATIADTTNTTAFTSPSFTPVAGLLYLLAVVHSDTAPEATVPTISTTTGLVFVQVSTLPFDTIASNIHRITLFRALKNSGLSTGTYTVNVADATTGCAARLTEVTNVITTGTDGANAIRNTITGNANATTPTTVTFAAVQNFYNALFVGFGSDLDTGGAPNEAAPALVTMGSSSYATPATTVFGVVRQIPNTLTVTGLVGGGSASDWGGIGVEAIAAVDTNLLEFVSPRLLDGFVPVDANYLTGRIWGIQSNALANITPIMEVYRRKPDGTLTLIFTSPTGVETGNNAFSAHVWPTGVGVLASGDVSFHEDDRVLVRVFMVNVGTMAGPYLGGVAYDDGIVGASHLLLMDGPELKGEADPANDFIIPSGGSMSGISNGQ